MAFIRPGRAGNRRLSLKGAVLLRVQKGRTYAQGWPRKRGKPKAAYQKAGLERMKVSQRMVRYLPERERTTMGDGLKRFLQTHTGVRGTAAIRLRDWLTQIIYGTAWAVARPDGKIFWSAKVRRDCSDFLDWTEPRIGSLLVRTGEGWRTTVNCQKGAMLTQVHGGNWQGCCKPATIPTAREAMGGTADLFIPTENPEVVPTDDFAADPLSSYTLYDTGNSVWQVKAGELRVVLGASALLLREQDGVLQDGYVECDCSQAYDIALVARVVDASNYYILHLRDQQGVWPRQLEITRRDSNGYHMLGYANPGWPRGELKTCRFEFVGNALKAYMNGVEHVSVTDSMFQTAGPIGFRNSGGPPVSILHRLEWGAL